ncbi:hypothetical protein BDW75DRAFT_244372 [Aspergillus navahoensis]
MLKQGLNAFLAGEVCPEHADMLLLVCCLSSGLVDSTLYNAYNTFVSMQTGLSFTLFQELGIISLTEVGNTIFVGLGASNQNLRPYGWARSLTSIGCFIVGCWCFAWLNRCLGARRRGTLMLSFFVQSLLVIVTAALVNGGAISGLSQTTSVTSRGEVPPWNQEVPIILLSLQSAGQIVASRALGFNEIPTVVITSLLCDLMSDPKLFLQQNEKRNRRVLAFALTLVGAIAGGWITKASGDIYAALWVAAGLKIGIVGFWGFWAAVPLSPA